MDKPSVYIETSIVSYLAADPSRHPVTLRNQQLTHEWWNTRRDAYALYTSALTVAEAARGNPEVAQRRLALLATIPVMAPPFGTLELARALLRGIPLPDYAAADAEHMALAAGLSLDYLLTWDSKHIANPRLAGKGRRIVERWGITPPIFCTPAALMGDV
jgi:hypothetical protein